MKTLDDAVIELNGVLPSPIKNRRNNENGWYLDNYGMLTHKDDCIWFKGDEFQQRAKELGFINGYRYGVEYPTNGKKPNLADDVVVKTKVNDVWCSGKDCVAMWIWRFAQEFRITDQRYKPQDTSYLHKPTYTPIKSADDCLVDHSIKTGQERYDKELLAMISEEVAKHGSISASLMSGSNTFEFPDQDDSDWWDYDNQVALRLPPVDTVVLVNFPHNRNLNATVVAHYGGKAVYVVAEESAYMDEKESFCPLDHAERKAELEKKRVIIEAVRDCITLEKQTPRQLLELLYDKGYLRLPAEKN
jgi:hypothetical protein